MMETTAAVISSTARRHGLQLHAEQLDGLVRYLHLLERWSATLNLTADPAPAVVAAEHLPDAMVIARLLRQLEVTPGVVVDVGSGAGFPALPLALLLPAATFTLVESRMRRCSFLNTAVHQLGLRARCAVLQQRLEQATLPAASLATSRATFPPQQWLELAPALVQQDGLVCLLTTDLDLAPESSGRLHREASERYTLASGKNRVAALYRRLD